MTQRTRLASIVLHPVFIAVANFAGVLAGWLGAHFEHKIAESMFPFFWPGTTVSGGATAFWIVALTFAVGMMLTLDAQSRESGETAERIEKGTHSLGLHVEQLEAKSSALLDAATDLGRQVHRLHTLPPPGFLEHFSRGGKALVAAAFNAEGRSRADRQALVRAMLTYLLTLASKFDNDGDQCRYGANVMIFRPSTPMPAAELEAIRGRLHFCENTVDVSRLRGVLDLDLALSAATGSRGLADDKLVPMALPISADAPLPGAAQAFSAPQPIVFEAASDLAMVEGRHVFSKVVMDKMHAFFKANEGVIASFMCFPVYSPGDAEGPPIAVLNLHRNLPNKLAGEKLPLLDALFAPLCMALGAVIDTLYEAGTKLPD